MKMETDGNRNYISPKTGLHHNGLIMNNSNATILLAKKMSNKCPRNKCPRNKCPRNKCPRNKSMSRKLENKTFE